MCESRIDSWVASVQDIGIARIVNRREISKQEWANRAEQTVANNALAPGHIRDKTASTTMPGRYRTVHNVPMRMRTAYSPPAACSRHCCRHAGIASITRALCASPRPHGSSTAASVRHTRWEAAAQLFSGRGRQAQRHSGTGIFGKDL